MHIAWHTGLARAAYHGLLPLKTGGIGDMNTIAVVGEGVSIRPHADFLKFGVCALVKP
jgi:hypothetical protein